MGWFGTCACEAPYRTPSSGPVDGLSLTVRTSVRIENAWSPSVYRFLSDHEQSGSQLTLSGVLATLRLFFA